MAFHHGTIRSYTTALLDFFNNLEVQHLDSNGVSHVRSIPIVYSSKEKSTIIDGHTAEQLSSGNYNVLPRANIALSTLVKSEQRIMNKNHKIGTKSNPDTREYMFNSVPYEFTFELSIQCRGMNEAAQVVEQIAPMFNPTVNIDIWDAQNLDSPTRVPVRLLDISIENEEFEELSSNITTVSAGLSIIGNLYSPIKSTSKIKQFKISTNESYIDGTYNKKLIQNWDVDAGGNAINETAAQIQGTQYPPVVVDITSVNPVIVGSNNLTVIWDDTDNKFTEMSFTWAVIQGTATLTPNKDKAVLDISVSGTVEVQCTVTDPFGNFATVSKLYTV